MADREVEPIDSDAIYTQVPLALFTPGLARERFAGETEENLLLVAPPSPFSEAGADA